MNAKLLSEVSRIAAVCLLALGLLLGGDQAGLERWILGLAAADEA